MCESKCVTEWDRNEPKFIYSGLTKCNTESNLKSYQWDYSWKLYVRLFKDEDWNVLGVIVTIYARLL